MDLPVGLRVVATPTDFEHAVADVVRSIPAGRVASYGQIADWVGRPAGARAVGGALARSSVDMPAHRVVNAAGRLAPGWEAGQAELLRIEGVRVWRGHVAEPIPWWPGPGGGGSRARGTGAG
jgi:methylated-DNA-protein-cysteine methyltransferase-like protein